MNEITNQPLSMTSIEIAALTEKRHDNVLRDVEKMAKELSSTLRSPIESTTYRDSNSIERKCYVLDKELTLTLVSGYNVLMRHAIVTRWLELEKVAAIHAPVDYAIVGAMITAAVTAALKGLLGNLPAYAYAVPTEPVVERAAQPFRTLAPGFLPWREARHVYLPGHSEAVFHQVMAAGRVAKQAFDVQFSDMQVNRECISYQENLISFACNAFISQSRRFRRTDGTVTENRWTNPSLDQAYYTYAGDYEPLTFL